jgi:ribosome-binding factor A
MKPKLNAGEKSQRQLRVGEQIRHVLAEIMRRSTFRDPDLQNLNVSVTEVRISPDLKNATAYVISLGGDRAATDKIVTALNRAAPFLRGELAREIELRNTPALKFAADTSLDYAQKIDALLKVHGTNDT